MPPPVAPASVAGRLTAGRFTGALRIDGRLDEAQWTTTDSISDFRQREPLEGAPASERTVVRVLSDAAALYVGVRAYDSEPGGIRGTQLRRDASLGSDDFVTLLIDGFQEHRGAFLFSTNPNGAMEDAQFSGGEDANRDWNGIWEVVARRDSLGWSAEFRIPFQTLRFRPGATAFGFNVRRSIRRKNEEALWRSWGRSQGLLQLLETGELEGLGPLSRGRDVELRPYLLSQATLNDHDVAGTDLGGGGVSTKAGLDAKLGLLPTLTADLTVNTDFAQVEVDRQVINLTRFPLFFPEKREFFLESSGLFSFGSGESAQLFYSRRIGLKAGEPVPILGGARLYGKLGPWAVGVLGARTGKGDEASDLVVRVKHDLFDRAYIGGIATLRSAPGMAGTERAFGVDINLPLVVHGKNVEPSLWLAGTSAPGSDRTPMAWSISADFPNDLFDIFAVLRRIEAGFSPALGFVRRTGILESRGKVEYTPRPNVLGLRQLDIAFPIPNWSIIAAASGSLTRSSDWQSAEFEWRPMGGEFQNGDQFEFNIQRILDAPDEEFEIADGVTIPAGRYWWTRAEAQYETSSGRPLSLSAQVSAGDFYTGSNTEVELGGTWRPGGRLIVGVDLNHSAIRLPEGRFNAVEGAGRVEYAFNTRASLQSFVQYNSEDQRVDFNVRFHWIPKAGDDLFVVWNSGYPTDPLATRRFPSLRGLREPLNGALVVKAVHRLAR